MTREEAITWLKDHHSIDLNTQDDEAHRMAIKALEQESVLDKIREEISECADRLRDSLYGDGMRHCIEIIDEYKAESEKEGD